MPCVLVQYYTETGNTRAMAELVAEGAGQMAGVEVRLRSVDESTLEDLIWCDGIALGAPTHYGSVPWRLKRWWDETAGPAWMNVDGKFGCAFATCGGLGGGAELACMGLLTILMNYGLLVFGVTDYAARGHTLHYGAAFPGPPNSEAKKEICRRLGRRLAEWTVFYEHKNALAHPGGAEYPRRG